MAELSDIEVHVIRGLHRWSIEEVLVWLGGVIHCKSVGLDPRELDDFVQRGFVCPETMRFTELGVQAVRAAEVEHALKGMK